MIKRFFSSVMLIATTLLPATVLAQIDNQLSAVEDMILSGQPLPQDPNEYYVLGEVAANAFQRGDTDKAVRMYRRLMAAYPNWPRPALDLALIYFQQQRFSEAKKLLEAQLSTKLPAEVESAMLDILKRITDQERFYYGIDLNVSPDNNINNATFNETVTLFGIPFTLNPDSRPKSDILLTAAGKIGYKIPLNQRSKIIAQFDVETSWYQEYSEYNQQRYGIELRYVEQLDPKSQLGLQYRHARTYGQGNHLTSQNRLSGNYTHSWRENCWWQLSPSFEVGTNQRNRIHDYEALAVDASLSPCWQRGYFTLGVKRHEANASAYSHTEKSIGIGATLIDHPSVEWSASAKLAFSDYDQASFGQKAPREDRNLQVTTRVGLPKIRPWKYYYPSLSVKYARNYSSYEYFENEKWQAFLELKREY